MFAILYLVTEICVFKTNPAYLKVSNKILQFSTLITPKLNNEFYCDRNILRSNNFSIKRTRCINNTKTGYRNAGVYKKFCTEIRKKIIIFFKSKLLKKLK